MLEVLCNNINEQIKVLYACKYPLYPEGIKEPENLLSKDPSSFTKLGSEYRKLAGTEKPGEFYY